MSAFTCYIEAEAVDSTFLASSNHRGNGSMEYWTSPVSRKRAALDLAHAIAQRRGMTLVAFIDMEAGRWQARFEDAPEQEGA